MQELGTTSTAAPRTAREAALAYYENYNNKKMGEETCVVVHSSTMRN